VIQSLEHDKITNIKYRSAHAFKSFKPKANASAMKIVSLSKVNATLLRLLCMCYCMCARCWSNWIGFMLNADSIHVYCGNARHRTSKTKTSGMSGFARQIFCRSRPGRVISTNDSAMIDHVLNYYSTACRQRCKIHWLWKANTLIELEWRCRYSRCTVLNMYVFAPNTWCDIDQWQRDDRSRAKLV